MESFGFDGTQNQFVHTSYLNPTVTKRETFYRSNLPFLVPGAGRVHLLELTRRSSVTKKPPKSPYDP